MASEGTVLLVDDHEATIGGLRELLERADFTVHATTKSEEVPSLASTCLPDVILLDVMMPNISGIDLCHQLKQYAPTRLTPIVLMTGSPTRDVRLRALAHGADDIFIKPLDLEELRIRLRALVRVKRLTDELDSSEQLFLALARFIEARDPTTDGHCERLADYAVALGRELSLPPADLAVLHRGGYLHDVGKIAVPDRVLLKKGRLTKREFSAMRQHTAVGDQLCGTIRSFKAVRAIVRHHHERLDGKGYPDGLVGDEIPLLAQIVTVVDVYDALTTDRPYRKAFAADTALAIMREEAQAGAYSLDLLESFAKVLRENRNAQTTPSAEPRAEAANPITVGKALERILVGPLLTTFTSRAPVLSFDRRSAALARPLAARAALSKLASPNGGGARLKPSRRL